MKDAALATLEKVTSYYEDQLWAGGVDSAPLQYLMGTDWDKGQRGFTEETLRKFRIGYAPEVPITSALPPTDIEILESLKHVYEGSRSDMFAGRVTFPIMDQQSRPRGFSARLMSTAPNAQKYINSGSSFLFRKGDYLFGMNHAREAIWKANNAIVVEGFTDTLAGHQTGKPIVIGAMGTYFTLQQLLQLGQYTMNLYMAMDPDSAGDESTRKAIEMAKTMGFRLGRIEFPEGSDPDEYWIRTQS